MNILWRASHKLYKWGKLLGFARILEILNNIICSNGISTKCEIGINTVFFHHGIGCVVHDDAIIGDNCRIFGNVTIGNKWSEGKNTSGPPHIGNGVLIGAGAVLLGEISVGDNAMIGANAVVLHDVPENATVVGVPARIIRGKVE